jgi:hypothetical protein
MSEAPRRPILVLSVTLALGLALLAVLLLRPPQAQHPVEAMLASAGLALELPPHAAIEWADADGERLSAASVEIGSDRLRIRVLHDLDPAAADTAVVEQRLQISELFEDRQAPYPGQLSNTLRCPEMYQPQPLALEEPARWMVRLYANDRMAFGGCSDDLLHYQATVGLFYDRVGQRLVRLEYFAPRQGPVEPAEALLRSLRFTSGS